MANRTFCALIAIAIAAFFGTTTCIPIQINEALPASPVYDAENENIFTRNRRTIGEALETSEEDDGEEDHGHQGLMNISWAEDTGEIRPQRRLQHRRREPKRPKSTKRQQNSNSRRMAPAADAQMKIYEFTNFDQRFPGEVSCSADSYRKTTYGVDELQFAVAATSADEQGQQIFNITMRPSADCSHLVPQGYNIKRQRQTSNTIEVKKFSSLQSLARASELSVGASVSVSIFGVSAGVSIERTQSSSSTSSSQSEKNYYLAVRKAVDYVAVFDSNNPPKLVDKLQAQIDEFEVNTNMTSNDFLRKFLHKQTHFLSRTESGSHHTEITSISKTVDDRMSRSSSELQVSAHIKTSYASVEAHYSQKDSATRRAKEMNEAMDKRTITGGAPFDMHSNTFDISENPVILTRQQTPICQLLSGKSERMKALKLKCNRIHASEKLSLLQLHQNAETDHAFEAIKRGMDNMLRKAVPETQKTLIVFQHKVDTGKDGDTFTSQRENIDEFMECEFFCADLPGVHSWTLQRGVCECYSPRVNDFREPATWGECNMLKYEKLMMSTAYRGTACHFRRGLKDPAPSLNAVLHPRAMSFITPPKPVHGGSYTVPMHLPYTAEIIGDKLHSDYEAAVTLPNAYHDRFVLGIRALSKAAELGEPGTKADVWKVNGALLHAIESVKMLRCANRCRLIPNCRSFSLEIVNPLSSFNLRDTDFALIKDTFEPTIKFMTKCDTYSHITYVQSNNNHMTQVLPNAKFLLNKVVFLVQPDW